MNIAIIILFSVFIQQTFQTNVASSKSKPPLPRLLLNPSNCPLNACEMLMIWSQVLLNSRGYSGHNDAPNHKNNTGYKDAIDRVHFELNFVERIKSVERRLRSIEQPVWKITAGDTDGWNRCTEGLCRCQPATKSLICWNSRIRRMPGLQVVPLDILKIDLSNNYLSTLHKETFRGLMHLTELDLSQNHLDYLSYDLFHDLDSLTKLFLQKNNLDELLSETFVKLRNLIILDLSHNQFVSIPGNLLHSTRRITVINLSNNQLKTFPVDLLKETLALEDFDVSRNAIETIHDGTFVNLAKLKTLNLSQNKIAIVNGGAFNLEALQVLNFRQNQLVHLSDKLLEKLINLIKLDLSINRLTTIDQNAFKNLVNLSELHLGQNSFSTLPEMLFVNQCNLRSLLLFSNNLSGLKENTFMGLTKVTSLLLNNNVLKELSPFVLVTVPALNKLRLDSNKLQFLPNALFDNNPNLTSVKLDKNPWHCDCKAIYLARWLRSSRDKLWDNEPMCRGPGNLGGNPVGKFYYSDLCDGQWASMLSLAPRLAVRRITTTSSDFLGGFTNRH